MILAKTSALGKFHIHSALPLRALFGSSADLHCMANKVQGKSHSLSGQRCGAGEEAGNWGWADLKGEEIKEEGRF